MKSYMLKTMAIATSLITAAFSADPTDAPGFGVDRIEKQPKYYAYFVKWEGVHGTGFGVYNKGQHTAEMGNINENGSMGEPVCPNNSGTFYTVAERDERCYPTSKGVFGGEHARTLTNDIRRALLDKDLFDTYMLEDNFSAAWQLATDNEQGLLWKRQAVAAAKKEISAKLYKGIMFRRGINLTAAQALVDTFKDLEPYSDLSEFMTQESKELEYTNDSFLLNVGMRVIEFKMNADEERGDESTTYRLH